MSYLIILLRKLAGAAMVSYRRRTAKRGMEVGKLYAGRIALLKLDGIGDFVLATASLRLFEKYLPGASITLFCRRPVGDLARQQFPGWNVVELAKKQRPLATIYAEGGMRKRLKSQAAFDLLLDLRAYRDMSDSAVASWIPAHVKIALANAYPPSHDWVRMPWETQIYDIILPAPSYVDADVAHDIQNHRALARFLLPECEETASALPRMAVSPAAQEEVSSLLETRFRLERGRPFLLVCPGTSTLTKEYPTPALAQVIEKVIASMPMPVVITGSPSDERTTKPLYERLRTRCEVIDVSGLLNLPQHTALITMARALLTMDSCHAHIAGATGTPAVIVIGGGHYGFFAPWGEPPMLHWLTNKLPCFGCEWQCIHERPLCITDIPAAEIAERLIESLNARQKSFPR